MAKGAPEGPAEAEPDIRRLEEAAFFTGDETKRVAPEVADKRIGWRRVWLMRNLTAELPTLLNDFLGVNDTHGITKDEMTAALDTLLMPQIDDDESGTLEKPEIVEAIQG